MSTRPVDVALAPLLNSMSPAGREWMSVFFASEDALSLFSGLESEMFILDESVPQSVLMTSAIGGEGRTTMAILMAALSALHDPNRRILLVDADTSTATTSDTFSLGDAIGLQELLGETHELSVCIHPSAFENLSILPMGKGRFAGASLPPQALEKVMQQFLSEYDLVVVDGPSSNAVQSVLPLAKVVHNCIIVVQYGGPDREQIGTFRDKLYRLGVNVLGCILNQREHVIPDILYGAK